MSVDLLGGVDLVEAQHLTGAMSDLEEARLSLRNAAKRLHLAGVGSPIHRNVSLLMDAVSEEESRLAEYMGAER